MKRLIYHASVAILILAASCSGGNKTSSSDSAHTPDAEQQTPLTETIGEDFKVVDGTIISSNGLPMIIDFSAEWCPPCRQLKPIFASLKSEYAGKVDFVTINVDSMPQLAQKYNVESIPNMVYVSPEGKELHRTVGFMEASQIKADISKYLNK